MKYLILFVFLKVSLCNYNIKEVRNTFYEVSLNNEVYELDSSVSLEKLNEEDLKNVAQSIWKKNVEQSNTQRIISKTGQSFTCSIPKIIYETDEPGAAESYNPKYLSEVVSASFYVGRCIILDLGWWKYEVCHGKSIKQEHGTRGDAEYASNSLGYFSGRYEMPDFVQSSKERLLYFEEIYDGGTPCDLADNNVMRKTALRFECDPKLDTSAAYISDVQELSSCNYRIVVKVGSLCKLKPFIIPKKSNAQSIKCTPTVTEEDLVLYLRDKVTEIKNKKKGEKLLQDVSLELMSIKRRKSAAERTSISRLPKFQTERMIEINTRMDDIFERYFNYSYYVQNGKMPDEDAMKSLRTLATIMGGVEIAYTDFLSESDQNQAYLWHFFHDPYWPKYDYPFSLEYVDIANEYYNHVLKEYDEPYHKPHLYVDPADLEKNILIRNAKSRHDIIQTLRSFSNLFDDVTDASEKLRNAILEEVDNALFDSLVFSFATTARRDDPKIFSDEEQYKRRAFAYILALYNHVRMKIYSPRDSLKEKGVVSNVGALLDYLMEVRVFMKQSLAKPTGSIRQENLSRFYGTVVEKRKQDTHLMLINDYGKQVMSYVRMHRRSLLEKLWKPIVESLLQLKKERDVEKVLLAERIRKNIDSGKIVTTVSYEALKELFDSTDFDKSALKIEILDVSGAEDIGLKTALEEEMEERRNARKLQEAFDVYGQDFGKTNKKTEPIL
ncbi:unnamed protein product [Auanema sp. JU1783]|nr:unnamed protein product [Auanema sp. JU1783]